MKTPRLAFVTTLALLGCLCAAEKRPEVVVVSDVLSATAGPVRPEPGKPVYYLLLGHGEEDYGSILSHHVPRPDPKAIQTELVKVLARQGFIETKLGGPMPQLGLVFSWGSVNVDDFPEIDPETHEIIEQVYKENRKEIRKFVGADQINGQALTLVDGDRINEAFRANRVYIFVVAFDLPALARKQKTVVWRTRISIDLLEGALPDSFALMLADAAPYFGRATDKPIYIDDRTRAASVRLGELQVLEEVPASPPARRTDDPRRQK